MKFGKFVCAKCFDDQGLKEFINENASARRCTYCGRRGLADIAAEMREVCTYIDRCLGREWDMPENCLGRDNESDSGWAMEPTDTWDLFIDEYGFGNGPKELLDDLIDEFSDRQWIQRDPYGFLPCDDWSSLWDTFARQVKHEMRFVFFKVETRENYDHEPEPREILNSLGRIIDELGLVRVLKVGHSFVRARQHERAKKVSTVAEIGPPPAEFASQSRMSPAGISMFYGADTRRTAFEEVVENDLKLNRVTFGTFKALRPLRVLNLTNLPPIPTIFCDDVLYSSRMPLIFMKRFVQDAMKPIVRDGREHIDYVPTQVVSEYFRHLFRSESGEQLDGIMYPSSKTPGGICYTLFFDIGSFTDASGWRSSEWKRDEPVLKLSSIEKKSVTFAPPSFI